MPGSSIWNNKFQSTDYCNTPLSSSHWVEHLLKDITYLAYFVCYLHSKTFIWACMVIRNRLKWNAWNENPLPNLQGSQRFPKIKFHDFSMIFHDPFMFFSMIKATQKWWLVVYHRAVNLDSRVQGQICMWCYLGTWLLILPSTQNPPFRLYTRWRLGSTLFPKLDLSL